MTLHAAFYQMDNSPARMMYYARSRYPSLDQLLNTHEMGPLRDLSWGYSSYNAWDTSAGSIRHVLGDYATGEFIPRAFGLADETRQGRITGLRNNLPESHVENLDDLLIDTAGK
jgi:hypothetical protein